MTKLAKIVMAVSLGLNMLLIGFFLGHALTAITPEAFMRERQRELLGILSPETAAALQPRIAAMEARMSRTATALEAAKREIGAILSAPQFDEIALRQALDGLTRLREGAFSELGEFLVDAAKGSSVENRRKIAEHLERMPTRMPPP